MHSYNIAEARKRFTELVAAAEHGVESIVMRDGKPVAKISMLAPPRFRIGQFDGQVVRSDDFDTFVPDEFDGYR